MTGVRGEFDAGDVLAVRDETGQEIARGLSNFASEEIRKIAGAHTNQVNAILGYETQPEVIHRDNLALTPASTETESPPKD